MSQPILDVKNLTKQFDRFIAVDDVSFSVAEGEVLGLLGPNGAGKTTTIKTLLGLITPTSGSINYFGKDFSQHREYCLAKINFASAYSQIQVRLTVYENLRIYAGLYGISKPKPRILELFELLEITSLKDQLFWKLSSGQKTRVIIAKALLNKPRLILMDEPTAFLDPDIAQKVLELIYQLQEKEKVSILYTSHHMDEIEKVCDRVIFLRSGKIIIEDTPLGLTKRIGLGIAKLLLTFDSEQTPVKEYLKNQKYQHEFTRTHMVEIQLPERDIPKVLFGLSKQGVWLTEIDVEKPNLEDVFLSIAKGNV